MTQPEPAPGAPTEPTTAPTAEPAEPTEPGPDPNAPVDIESLPANVQNLIKKARSEAASARVTAKEKAAQEAREQLLGQIAEALGLEEPPLDPAELAGQLESTRSDAAAARLELDVYRTALKLGADADKLLDSMAFRTAVDDLPDDLPDENFSDALKELIRQRVDADPSLRLAAAPAGGGSQPVTALRPGTLPAPPAPSLDDQITEAQKAGNWREVIRLNGLKAAARTQQQ
jgi:hypothetical protein